MTTIRHTNKLAGETSPYLLQHAHNPVNWHPWSEEALRLAAEKDNPILLSIGYAACHWCHVMERESFENVAIADLMNRHYICIKVDREERPDLDSLYMTAVQLMTGQGGWPMTVFLTPSGKPFYGGTYFPPSDMMGRPGFPRILSAVADAWTNRREEILNQAESLAHHVKQSTQLFQMENTNSQTIDLDAAFNRIGETYDDRFGGFGTAPKFPQPMILEFLLRYATHTGNTNAMRMVRQTLHRMADGGIYDQLGGGFHRYSTDEQWLVPHFEKMLYDNAQLALVYLHAWQATGENRFADIAIETLDYIRREMTDPTGGFHSTQDADSEGIEGRFFVWSRNEIESVLGRDAATFIDRYGVTETGNWEGTNILHLDESPAECEFALQEFNAQVNMARSKLFQHRENRIKPAKDDKIISAWNGMMLGAFAEAGASLGRADYIQTAINNAIFIIREMHANGELMRTGRQMPQETPEGMAHPPYRSNCFQLASIPAFLEDYASVADGFLKLYEATFDAEWILEAIKMTDALLSRFGNSEGLFYSTAKTIDLAHSLFTRPIDITDNAVPAGNSVAVDILLRLHSLTGESRYRLEAERVIRGLRAMVAEHPLAFGRLLCAVDYATGPSIQIVIVANKVDERVREMVQAVKKSYYPNVAVVVSLEEKRGGYRLPIAANKPMIDGNPTAYLCANGTCSLPVVNPEQLRGLLVTMVTPSK